ncbi:DUF222 domain-containing protein [Pseudonocardia nematodicida]|uniref:DUF222 domain-containing protein n=1 Tax=Pseudonocardia nematodicida TaxID=1206997 RepID=A0ABV1K899_9PSEU
MTGTIDSMFDDASSPDHAEVSPPAVSSSPVDGPGGEPVTPPDPGPPRWSEHPPDAALFAVLECPPDAGTSSFERVERITAFEVVIARLQVMQSEEIDGFVGGAEREVAEFLAHHDPARDGRLGPMDNLEGALDSATAEIRFALHLTRTGAGVRVYYARRLFDPLLAPTAKLARAGRLTWPKIMKVLDGADNLTEQQTTRLQAAVLPKAPTQTTGQLGAAIARFLVRLGDEVPRTRRERKARSRAVVVSAEPDGMAVMRVFLPAAAATGVYGVLDQHARGCGSADPRSMDERRTDALVDLVLHGTGYASEGSAAVVAAVAAAAAEGRVATGEAAVPAAPAEPVGPAAGTGPVAVNPFGIPRPRTGDTGRTGCNADCAPSAGSRSAGSGAGSATSGCGDGGRRCSGRAESGRADSGGESGGRAFEPSVSGAGSRSGAPAATPSGPDEEPVTPVPIPGIAPAPPGGTPAARNSVQIRINVTISADTLIGADDEPAELAGFGPIPASDARALAFDPAGIWTRLFTDPVTGQVQYRDPTTYRPDTKTDAFVRARFPTCATPGCRVPSHRCDLDHVVPHRADGSGGLTVAENLCPHCRGDHLLKHCRGWSTALHADGTVEWTTPSGHTYRTDPSPVGPVRATNKVAQRGPSALQLMRDPELAARVLAEKTAEPPF